MKIDSIHLNQIQLESTPQHTLRFTAYYCLICYYLK